ncbi:MAG: hypothetical protein HYU85_00345, partial [Chloroflexi bacterium]|nr:hypothetical protein [Chloroflexota bacterium]
CVASRVAGIRLTNHSTANMAGGKLEWNHRRLTIKGTQTKAFARLRAIVPFLFKPMRRRIPGALTHVNARKKLLSVAIRATLWVLAPLAIREGDW